MYPAYSRIKTDLYAYFLISFSQPPAFPANKQRECSRVPLPLAAKYGCFLFFLQADT